jgi:hypothetical protein
MTGLADDLRFHARALGDYLHYWESSGDRERAGVSEDEAAYHLLEHAGWLDRHAGASEWAGELRALPADDRRRLARAACRYAGGITWADRARRLLAADALSADEFEEVEDLLVRRDALETVWAVARELVADFLSADSETGRGLALARCVAAEIDEVLAGRPDVASVAARVLGALPPPLPVPAELSAGWWYAGVRDLDRWYSEPPFRFAPRAAPRPAQRFEPDPEFALAASAAVQHRLLKGSGGEVLNVRWFPRDPGGRVYTVALDPVPADREVTLLLDERVVEPVAPADYLAAQRLLYMYVPPEAADRLADPGARLRVEWKDNPGAV